MPDPINLRQARKAKARAEKEQQADENRFLFGQSKAQKLLRATVKERLNRTLDQGKLELMKKPDQD
jgi:Domain of unknown function (DUF4169)